MIHKHDRTLQIGIVVMMLSLLLTACSPSTPEDGDRLKIGFAAMNVEMTWMKFAYHAMHNKAAALDIELITYDASNDVRTQALNIEDFIEQGVDAIITDPVDVEGLIPALELASRKGVPVVAFDRSAEGAPYLFFVGSDDVEAGRIACRFLAGRLGGQGKIVVIEGAIGSSPSINRSQGFDEELERHPGLEVVFRASAGFFREEGYRVMEEVLASVPSFDAVYAQNDDMILGAIEAMENASLSAGKVLTIGTDAIPGALEAIEDGRLDATIQYPISQAEIALEELVSYLETGILPEWESFLVIPWLITKNNIDSGDFFIAIDGL